MKLRKRKESQTGIDISPLIDIVFILLIFFMVSTTFVKDLKVDINRPSATSVERASTKSIRVFIDKQADIYLDGKPVRPWALQNHVKEKLASSNQKSVLVISDGKVNVDKLVEVVDQCRLAGAEHVGVATEYEGSI